MFNERNLRLYLTLFHKAKREIFRKLLENLIPIRN